MAKVKSKRKWMKFFRQSYAVSRPSIGNQPKLDVIDQRELYAFHYGVPLNELRMIASWSMTECAGHERVLAKVIPSLWKRKGREDCIMAGFFLANLPPATLGEHPWMAFVHLLQKTEPIEMVLEITGELVRAGHDVPSKDWFDAMAQQSDLWHQYAVLMLSKDKSRAQECSVLITTAPKGGELFERIRTSLITPKN